MTYHLTKHAIRRMDERGISMPMVMAVAHSGQYAGAMLGQTVAKKLCGYVVVLRGSQVITVYEAKR